MSSTRVFSGAAEVFWAFKPKVAVANNSMSRIFFNRGVLGINSRLKFLLLGPMPWEGRLR